MAGKPAHRSRRPHLHGLPLGRLPSPCLFSTPACRASLEKSMTRLPSMAFHPSRRVWHVELPSIKGQLKVILILTIIAVTQNLLPPLLLTQGGPANTTWVPVLYMYENAFQYAQMGYALSIAFILFVVSLVLALVTMRYLRTDNEKRGRKLHDKSSKPHPEGQGTPLCCPDNHRGTCAFSYVLHGRYRTEERDPARAEPVQPGHQPPVWDLLPAGLGLYRW